MATYDTTTPDTRWADWVNIVLGILLIIAPFVLGFQGVEAEAVATPPAAESPATAETPAATGDAAATAETPAAGEAAEAADDAAEAADDATEAAEDAVEDAAEDALASVDANYEAAQWNAIVCGVLIVVLAFLGLSRAEWAEWTNAGTGVWVIIVPWILSFSALQNATWTHVIIGILVVIFAAYRGSQIRRSRAATI